MRPIRFAAVLALLLMVLSVPGSSAANAPCVVRSDAAAAVSLRGPGIGVAPACTPSMACFSPVCTWTVEAVISGVGVVGVEVVGEGFTPVACGPAARSCSVSSPAFTAPPGAFVRCSATTIAAVDVELACVPTKIG